VCQFAWWSWDQWTIPSLLLFITKNNKEIFFSPLTKKSMNFFLPPLLRKYNIVNYFFYFGFFEKDWNTHMPCGRKESKGKRKWCIFLFYCIKHLRILLLRPIESEAVKHSVKTMAHLVHCLLLLVDTSIVYNTNLFSLLCPYHLLFYL